MTPAHEAAVLLPNLSTWLCSVTASCLASGRPKAREARPRVLVVDDESTLCELLSLSLGQKGLEVATVRSANEATVLVERGQFDLVILDGELDGAEGLNLLRLSKTRHPDIPVILFIGAGLDEPLPSSGLAHAPDAIVRKLDPLSALSAEVFRHLERRKAQPRQAA
jgi:two-component system OmpR family response regulator